MTINLQKILQDAEEFEKVRDAATPGEWISSHDGYGAFNIVVGPIQSQKTAAFSRIKENGNFIAAAKNYDSTAIIKQLVERVKRLEKALTDLAETCDKYYHTDDKLRAAYRKACEL